MVAALGIAASLLSDVGYKALKGLVSGKSSGSSGISLPAGLTGATQDAGQNLPAKSIRGDLNSLFAKVDTDGDGSLSKQEFMSFKQQVDQTLTALLKTQESSAQSSAKSAIGSLDTSADKIFAAFDQDGDGKVTPGEFAKAVLFLAADASALFARNLYNFLSAFWDKEQGKPVLDEEIGNAIRLTQGGKVVNARLLG